MSFQKSRCDNCSSEMACRNLSIAFEIITEELRWADRPDLEERFLKLKMAVEEADYTYPRGVGPCELRHEMPGAAYYVEQARILLKELRENLKIVSY